MTKTLLITGTSTGLGLSLSILAAKAGYRVFATMRDLAKREGLEAAARAAEVDVELLQLDVQSTESVDRAVAEVLAKTGQIDILVNNAGSGFVRNIEQAEEAEIAAVMDVNFMGVMRCTRAVLPHMRARKSGHVINVSSVGGLVGQPFNEIYCAAKFAVEGFTESLATYVTHGFGVHFTSVQPGGISTEFATNVLKQVEATGGMLQDAYLPLLQTYIAGAQSRMGGGAYQTAEEVAETILACMAQETPPVRLRTSAWAEDFCQLKTSGDPDGRKQQEMIISTMLRT